MRWSYMMIALGFAGCEMSAPTVAGPNLNHAAAQRACYGVQFHGEATLAIPGPPGILLGSISGDLEGAARHVAIPGAPDGKAIKSTGRTEFEITGGIVPELVGHTIAGDFEVISIRIPDQPGHFSSRGKMRIDDGAESGNFTFHGMLDFPSGFVIDWDYNGSVCP